MSQTQRVCIVGGGPQGLAALKNLLELNSLPPRQELFSVDLLERRHTIGGVWSFSEETTQITALRNTLQNTSRFRNCFSDFPVSKAWQLGERKDVLPFYLTQEQSAFYLRQYADYFDLAQHIRFGYGVQSLNRNQDKQQWDIEVKHEASGRVETWSYDKVIVATGQHHIPMTPHVEGMEHFRGRIMHASELKSAESMQDQFVLLVGSSNSAGDVATEIAKCTKKLMLSRRRGLMVARRMNRGRPSDLTLTRRLDAIIWMISSFAPAYFTAKFASIMRKMIVGGWGERLKPEWQLNPENAASICFQAPMVSDTFVPLLERGKIEVVPHIRKITADGHVELEDDRVIDPDTLIFATGYNIDSTLSALVRRCGDLQLPRLYHNIYHPEYPDSLAYLTFWFTIAGIYEFGDLASMGIAQVFAGKYKLPNKSAMERQIDRDHAFVNDLASRVPKPISIQGAQRCVDRGPWITFLHEVAGTEVMRKLSYSLSGWWYWVSDRDFCHLLMTGVNSIHTARLFDGRPGSRKKWDGAKQAILDANKELQEAAMAAKHGEESVDEKEA